MVLKASPGAHAFSCDMLLIVFVIAEWLTDTQMEKH